MELYVGARPRAAEPLNELRHLPRERRAIVPRTGSSQWSRNILKIHLPYAPTSTGAWDLKLPAAMLYFGMINWTHTWMDPSGPGPKPAKIALDGLIDGTVPR